MSSDSDVAKTSLPVGEAFGDFRILGRLGSGGMGEVYLAEQLSLRRRVALKVLRSDLVDDPSYLRRFQAEARAAAALNHANIVNVYGIGELNGVHYIAMEYVQGITLREYIQRKGHLTFDECVTVMVKVAGALQRAAEEGVIHRDIKPENVMVSRKNEVKVMDFGLARHLTGEDMHLTQSGVTMGTPLYMSPEQLQGLALDPRTDLYSFGVMAYHMLAGRPPFQGETAVAVAMQHVSSRPEPLTELRPDVPPELVRIVGKMMTKKPADRYQTAKALLADLRKLRAGQPVDIDAAVTDLGVPTGGSTTMAAGRLSSLARTVTLVGQSIFEPKRRPWLALVSLAVALLVGGAFGWSARAELDPMGGPPAPKPAFRPPELPESEVLKDGFLQLLYARSLPADRREAGLWAVLERHRSAIDQTLDAGQELVQIYFARRDYASALQVAEALISRDDPEQQLVGFVFKTIVESRCERFEAARESSAKALEITEDVLLPPERLDWLAREFLAAQHRIGGDSQEQSRAFANHFKSRPRLPH